MKKPLISIIINNFNYASYVGEAIESALSQTYGRVEIVCVDDGSTDNSVEVISCFPTVRLLTKPNGGQTSAVRAGLAAATGEIVILLDADDVLYADACESIAKVWTADTVYVQYRLRLFSGREELSGTFPTLPFIVNHREYLLRHGRFPYAPASGNAFSRFWALKILEITQHPDRMAQDMILAMCAPFCGKVQVINRCLAKYRIHQGNFSWKVTLKDAYYGAEVVEDEIRKFAASQGFHIRRSVGLTGPYHYQNGIKLYLQGDTNLGGLRARKNGWRLAKSIASFPGLHMRARFKNIALGLFVLISPGLAGLLLGRFVSWSSSPVNQ